MLIWRFVTRRPSPGEFYSDYAEFKRVLKNFELYVPEEELIEPYDCRYMVEFRTRSSNKPVSYAVFFSEFPDNTGMGGAEIRCFPRWERPNQVFDGVEYNGITINEVTSIPPQCCFIELCDYIYQIQGFNDDINASEEDKVEDIKEQLYELTYIIIDGATAH